MTASPNNQPPPHQSSKNVTKTNPHMIQQPKITNTTIPTTKLCTLYLPPVHGISQYLVVDPRTDTVQSLHHKINALSSYKNTAFTRIHLKGKDFYPTDQRLLHVAGFHDGVTLSLRGQLRGGGPVSRRGDRGRGRGRGAIVLPVPEGTADVPATPAVETSPPMTSAQLLANTAHLLIPRGNRQAPDAIAPDIAIGFMIPGAIPISAAQIAAAAAAVLLPRNPPRPPRRRRASAIASPAAAAVGTDHAAQPDASAIIETALSQIVEGQGVPVGTAVSIATATAQTSAATQRKRDQRARAAAAGDTTEADRQRERVATAAAAGDTRQRDRMRVARMNSANQELDRARNADSHRIRRLNDAYHIMEQQQNTMAHQKARLDPAYREREENNRRELRRRFSNNADHWFRSAAGELSYYQGDPAQSIQLVYGDENPIVSLFLYHHLSGSEYLFPAIDYFENTR